MKKCPFCRSEIVEGATVCASCGARKEDPIEWTREAVRCVFLIAAGILAIYLGMSVSGSGSGSVIVVGLAVGGYGIYKAWAVFGKGERWVRKD